MSPNDDDCWDAFGSDDEEDDNEGDSSNEDLSAVATHLSQFLVRANPQVKLSDRLVGIVDNSPTSVAYLQQRGLTVMDKFEPGKVLDLDAVVVLDCSASAKVELAVEGLLPGGLFVARASLPIKAEEFFEPSTVYEKSGDCITAQIKRSSHVHASTCKWLPSSHSLKNEAECLEEATVSPSAFEISRGLLTASSIQRAVDCMNRYGYCIIRKLLDPKACRTWGEAVQTAVHDAAKILRDEHQVDIYNPHMSQSEPQSYRELSMREDFRLDLRHGSKLSQLRATEGSQGNEPMVVPGTTESFEGFLRGHASILDIVRLTMNPQKGDLYKGNLGRFNFGGSGTDGSFQDLRVSPVGGIISFPGAADQAIHADTPHLFEHVPDLPAHYINIFTPGTAFDPSVGGTAFFHGSHNLEFTTKHCGSVDHYKHIYPYLTRPCVTLGDVILFDCRTLHFGMSNTSDSVERVMLYTNTTHAWFTDPKNWDNERPIFQSKQG